nr:TusE/DsrC/DsvC family sulfur relay protein [Corynebacterium lactis]
MSRVLILGGGTAGSMVANRLRAEYSPSELEITVVDRDDEHLYQPGFLFLPFGKASRKQIVKSRSAQFSDGIRFIEAEIDSVDADANKVLIRRASSASASEPEELAYDHLIVATGTQPHPELTEGYDSEGVFQFYDLAGAEALREGLRYFRGGRVVVHVSEMPIKCPVAPLEFTFLVDSWLRKKGLREKTSVTYVTPLDGAFTKPVASAQLGGALKARQIELETDFDVERVDGETKHLVGYDGREIPFDMLVTVPVNMGAEFIARSGLGDEHNYVECDDHTMQSVAHKNIFVLGDAGTLPTSKAGAVAHFAVDIFMENFRDYLAGREMTAKFDGHANCFVETGDGQGMLLDFNYDTQPLTGVFPVPKVGPLKLLGESRINHWSKLAFRYVYWNILVRGRPLPLASAMSMAGKVPAGKEKPAKPAWHGGQLTIVPTPPEPSRLAEFTGSRAAAPAVAVAAPAESVSAPAPGGASVDTTAETSAAPAGPSAARAASASVAVPEEKAPNAAWTKEMATQRARELGVELDPAAWKVIDFMREDYPVRKETPTLRRVSTGAEVPIKDLYATFSGKPAKKMAWIAGLPKPRGCV